MRHTDAQIEEAARRFEELADQLGPASAAVDDLSDLRAIAEAADQVRRDEATVTERVTARLSPQLRRGTLAKPVTNRLQQIGAPVGVE